MYMPSSVSLLAFKRSYVFARCRKKKIQVNEREVVWRVLLTPSPDFSQVAMSAALPIICIKVSANLYGV
jgi:hypothetical protein